MWPSRTYTINFTNLRKDREICANDGVECGDCPVEEYCLMVWDSLQEVTEIYKAGVPSIYIKAYKNLFTKLKQKKLEKYNELVTAKGGNHGSPVR